MPLCLVAEPVVSLGGPESQPTWAARQGLGLGLLVSMPAALMYQFGFLPQKV